LLETDELELPEEEADELDDEPLIELLLVSDPDDSEVSDELVLLDDEKSRWGASMISSRPANNATSSVTFQSV
jgi:hypothetical protein